MTAIRFVHAALAIGSLAAGVYLAATASSGWPGLLVVGLATATIGLAFVSLGAPRGGLALLASVLAGIALACATTGSPPGDTARPWAAAGLSGLGWEGLDLDRRIRSRFRADPASPQDWVRGFVWLHGRAAFLLGLAFAAASALVLAAWRLYRTQWAGPRVGDSVEATNFGALWSIGALVLLSFVGLLLAADGLGRGFRALFRKRAAHAGAFPAAAEGTHEPAVRPAPLRAPEEVG